jgi:hypothetical protein
VTVIPVVAFYPIVLYGDATSTDSDSYSEWRNSRDTSNLLTDPLPAEQAGREFPEPAAVHAFEIQIGERSCISVDAKHNDPSWRCTQTCRCRDCEAHASGHCY